MYDSTCPSSGKRSYFSRATAEAEMRRLKRKGQKGGRALVRVYKCTTYLCGGWHLTSAGDDSREDWGGFERAGGLHWSKPLTERNSDGELDHAFRGRQASRSFQSLHSALGD